MKTRAVIAATLLSTAATLAYAQAQQSQPQDHDAHHPNTATQASPQTPTPPQAQAQAPTGQGGSMMGQGGMMGGGMMGGSGSMMSMMGNGMPMMGMMQMMGNSGGGMGGMATIDRIEGRIAFLKTELKITDEQSAAWNAFAETLRTNAKRLGELRASMMLQAGAAPKTLADRLEWQEKWLTARAEDTKAIRTAYTDLAAKLTDDQKTTADQILSPHMGMMTMMSGMGGGGMGMGQMGGGQMGMGGQMPPAQMPGNQMMQGNQMMAPKK